METRYFLFDSFAINDLKRGVPANEISANYGFGTIALGIVNKWDERSLTYCMELAIKHGTFLEISLSDYKMFLVNHY